MYILNQIFSTKLFKTRLKFIATRHCSALWPLVTVGRALSLEPLSQPQGLLEASLVQVVRQLLGALLSQVARLLEEVRGQEAELLQGLLSSLA